MFDRNADRNLFTVSRKCVFLASRCLHTYLKGNLPQFHWRVQCWLHTVWLIYYTRSYTLLFGDYMRSMTLIRWSKALRLVYCLREEYQRHLFSLLYVKFQTKLLLPSRGTWWSVSSANLICLSQWMTRKLWKSSVAKSHLGMINNQWIESRHIFWFLKKCLALSSLRF